MNEKVHSGLYTSSSEVIREGLRLLIRQEEQKNALRRALRADLSIAIEQLETGKSRHLDLETINQVKRNAGKKKSG